MSSTLTMFNSFKKLGWGFIKGNPRDNLINEEKRKIDTEVNEYLKNKMLEVVFMYVDGGYKLSSGQEKELFAQLSSIPPKEVIKMFNKVMEKGVDIPDDILAYSFAHLAVHLKDYLNFRNAEPIITLFFNKMNDDTFTLKVFNFWMENSNFVLAHNKSDFKYKICNTRITESFTYTHVIVPFEYFGSFIFKNKKLEDLSLAIEKIKELSAKYKKGSSDWKWVEPDLIKHNMDETLQALKTMMMTISSYSISHCSNEIADKRKKIGILYDSGELDKLVAEEYIKLGSQENIKNLPSKAKEILEDIKKDYLSLNKKLTDLTEEERFNIDNLWTKRIPEILNKYLRADPEFRATMKNNKGESIEDLLVVSLNNIHQVLNKIQEDHTKAMLNDMSALTNYTHVLQKGAKVSL